MAKLSDVVAAIEDAVKAIEGVSMHAELLELAPCEKAEPEVLNC